ncbi:MAG: bifunctional tetrahydrofolate synthase/dihydrofolate synthase [Methylococcaceae bacterium]
MRFKSLAEWLVWQETLHPRTIDLGLARVGAVYARMARAGTRPYTLTVGGTNGKGSCVAMLDAILRVQGYRVGTYTSPHLLCYNERVAIDGLAVTDTELCAAFERVDAARGDTSLSFFEFGTLAALDIFARAELDVQILEVGLGGRLDAVNLVDADVALIASIDLDHQQYLGDTRASIGYEKAGIFRPGKPAVLGDTDVPSSVRDYALKLGTPLDISGETYSCRLKSGGWNWTGTDRQLDDLPLPALPGTHQLANAAAVIQVLERARHARPTAPESIRQGLAHFRLSGRIQYLSGSCTVLVDVAHNPQAARILAQHLAQHHAGQRIHAVFAIMRDKDITAVIQPLKNQVAAWYLAPLAMERAASVPYLQQVFRDLSIGAVQGGFASAEAAFRTALDEAEPTDVVLIFGSFFLVAEFLAL